MRRLELILAIAVAAGGCPHDRASPQEAPKPARAAPAAGSNVNQPVANAAESGTDGEVRAIAAHSPEELATMDPPSAAAHAAASTLMAKILRGDRHGAYESLHSMVRAGASEAQFNASLVAMEQMYGTVTSAELKQEMLGVQESKQHGKQNFRKFTYAVSTTKYPKGTHFASVTTATDGDHVAAETYQVFFFASEIPPDLR